MEILKRLPDSIQHKIVYMVLEHPVATIFKKHIEIKRYTICSPPYTILQEYMIITDTENKADELRNRAVEIYSCDNRERSDIIDRKVMAYKLKFINEYLKTAFIFYGKRNGIIED